MGRIHRIFIEGAGDLPCTGDNPDIHGCRQRVLATSKVGCCLDIPLPAVGPQDIDAVCVRGAVPMREAGT